MLTYSYAKCQCEKYEATTKVYKELIDMIDAMLEDTKNNSLELRALKGDIYAKYVYDLEWLANWKADYDKERTAEELERMKKSSEIKEST